MVNATADLRSMALKLQAAEAGINVPATPAGIWGVVADLGLPGGSATIVALADGTASLYLSGGGGIIGAGTHERVKAAVAALIEAAEQSVATFSERGPRPLPPAGAVRFFAHSRRDLLASPELPQELLVTGGHSLSPCFGALNNLLSELQVASEPGA